MYLLKSIAIAFSLYSKIPMPQFPWEKKEMQYMLLFFPWIGAVIGVCMYGWYLFCLRFEVGTVCYATVGAAIPLLITGGFHMDGFLDTMDAFHSYQKKEKKLEILKDSHIGAFAVIMAAVYGLLYLGAFSEIREKKILWIVCAGFFLSRGLSGIGVVTFIPAKKDGMLTTFADHSKKKAVKAGLWIQNFCCIVFMIVQKPIIGGAVVMAAFASFFYYRWRTKKEFGGITGDTAGYFVLLCELMMLIIAAATGILAR